MSRGARFQGAQPAFEPLALPAGADPMRLPNPLDFEAQPAIRLGAIRIRAMASSWGLKGERWAYSLDEAGQPGFVSHYRYGSEQAALRAAKKDADALAAWRAQEIEEEA